MSYSNYEQTVIINGYALSGIQSVDGNYGITERPIKVAGVGFVDALVDAPLQGNFSFSRKMVGTDPLLETNSLGKYLLNEQEISGAILYDNDTKGFGFTKGRVSRYSVSCTVGEIPDIQTDITVYGNLGSGVAMEPATKEHPPIRYPDQSSIKITVSDFTIDPISDFSYSRAINTTPVYALPKGDASSWNDGEAQYANLDPIQIDTQYPIETDINFTMIASEYEIREIKDRIQAAPKSNVKIEIRDAQDETQMINGFTGYNMRLISESLGSTIDGEMTLSLTYKGYETLHNPVGELFEDTKYSLTLQGENGTEIGGGDYLDGTEVILRAVPDRGYRFLDWTIDSGDGILTDSNSSKTTFITSFSDTVISARYTRLYILYLRGDHGIEIGQGEYNAGDVVYISVTPDAGYVFDRWNVDFNDITISNLGNGNYSFVMPERDVSIVAEYTAIEYSISATSQNGVASLSQSTGTIGDIVSLNITPDEGYRIDSVQVSQGGITLTPVGDSAYSFIVGSDDVQIVVNYELINYSISIFGIQGEETASASFANFGDTIFISATPFTGYQFTSWTTSPVVTINQDNDGQYYFVMPSSNVSIVANYALKIPVWQTTQETISFDENSSGAVQYTNDLGPSGVVAVFSLTGQDQEWFNIDQNTGTLEFIDSPNYEEKNSYLIEIVASNTEGFSIKQINININDLPDIDPTWATESQTVNYTENEVSFVAYTNDLDPGDSAVSYSVIGRDQTSFSISSAGELSFNSPPDYETKNSYQVVIVAENASGIAYKLLNINILDVVDTAPVWGTLNQSVNFYENSTDYVSYSNDLYTGDSAVTYSLSGVDAASFSIDSQGRLSFNSSPDYESKNSYFVIIDATNQTGSSSKEITINVLNVADVPPVWATTSETIAYQENDTVLVGYTNDLDPGDSFVTYSISGLDVSSFTINQNGELSFVSPPDYEEQIIYNIYVTAASLAGSSSKNLIINIVNEADVSPIWDINFETVSYAENDTGYVSYTNDLTAGDSAIVYSLMGQDYASFSIDQDGNLSFNSPPDYEVKATYIVTIVASGAAGSALKSITINIQDVIDTAPQWETSSQTIEYPENSTSVVNYTDDLDAGDSAITYSLSGTHASSFSINNAGILTFNSSPDYEAQTSFLVNIIATNQTGSDQKALTINIVNKIDTAPTWTQPSEILSYTENATIAIPYDSSLSTGEGIISYGLSGVDAVLFQINSNAVLTFNASPNYEIKNVYNVTIIASNEFGFDEKTLTINIIDVEDVAPSWASSSETVDYYENSTSAVSYTNDLNPGDSVVNYSLAGQDPNSFSINNSGVLTFYSPPDFESRTSYSVDIVAINNRGFDIKTITINILNVADIAPSWTTSSESVEYSDSLGSLMVNYNIDLDFGDSVVAFSLSGSDASSFSVNSGGQISFNSLPDANIKDTYYVSVTATNQSGSTTKSLTITVITGYIDLSTLLLNKYLLVTVSVEDGYYVFKNRSSALNKFTVNRGTYVFYNVPSSHPIAFYNHSKPLRYGGDYLGGTKNGQDGNEYNYYYGNVYVDITGDFGEISYECFYHGYMGGQNNLKFSSSVLIYDNNVFRIEVDYSEYTDNALNDDDKLIIRDACDQLEEVILVQFPWNVSNATNLFNLKVEDFEGTSAVNGVLAYAGPVGISSIDNWQTAISTSGTMSIDPADVSNLRDSVDYKTKMFWTVIHEIVHALGVGPLWNFLISPPTVSNNFISLSTTNGAQYSGTNAVREYNSHFSVNFASLPVDTFLQVNTPSSYYANRSITQSFSKQLTQQDIDRGYILHNDPWNPYIDVVVDFPGSYQVGQIYYYNLYLTWSGHWAEWPKDSGPRTLNGQAQPLFEEELMTPYAEDTSSPMSRISIGFLHDLGWIVDYSKIEPEV